jgi:hypothetical protein
VTFILNETNGLLFSKPQSHATFPMTHFSYSKVKLLQQIYYSQYLSAAGQICVNIQALQCSVLLYKTKETAEKKVTSDFTF